RPGPVSPFISPSQNPAHGAARQIEPRMMKNISFSAGKSASTRGAMPSGMIRKPRRFGREAGSDTGERYSNKPAAGKGSHRRSTHALAGSLAGVAGSFGS